MLRNIIEYNQEVQSAIKSGEHTWAKIKEQTSDLMYRLTQQKFELPKDGEEKVVGVLKKLNQDIHETFRSLQD